MIYINIILLIINFFLFFKNYKEKREDEIFISKRYQTIRQDQQAQQQYITLLLKSRKQLEQQTTALSDRYSNLTSDIEKIEEQKKQAEKNLIDFQDNLDKNKKEYQQKIVSEINKINKQREQTEKQLDQIKNVYQAATAARLREQEEQDKKIFYQLQIPKKQISDINKLENWKSDLNDPSIVAKIIWSSYIMKATSDMCNRILGSSVVCGIYKITNNISGDVYIGQSVVNIGA